MSVDIETDEIEESVSVPESIIKNISEKALLSTGIRVGTLVKTKSMSQFVSRTRADGLHIIDVSQTLTRIEIAA